MTTEKLQAKLWRHNASRLVLGIALCAVAPVLWVGSFWVGRYLFYLPFLIAGVHGMWPPSLYAGWGFTVLLAIEGLRSSGPLFDLKEYTESDFNWYERDDGSTASVYARYHGDPLLTAWAVVQLLRIAPQTTIFAIQTLRSVIRASPEAIERAATIFAALEADRRWHAARSFGECGLAIRLLKRLELIWVQGGSDGLEIRFPAGMSEAELV